LGAAFEIARVVEKIAREPARAFAARASNHNGGLLITR
jgi:hypothetical protein